MLKLFGFFLINLIVFELEASSNEISCESINDFSFGYAGKFKTCDFDGSTKIDSLGVTISSEKDETIAAVQFARNKKIFYLPEKVSEKFTNLILYSANECLIREISKLNFKSLKFLKSLYLHNNQIEKIPGDTFEDLVNLNELELRKNIKLLVSCFQIDSVSQKNIPKNNCKKCVQDF